MQEAPLFHLFGKRVVGKEGQAGVQPQIVVDLERVVLNPGIVQAIPVNVAVELRERTSQLVAVDGISGIEAGAQEQRVSLERVRDLLLTVKRAAALIEVA